jgi:hypothetical protein
VAEDTGTSKGRADGGEQLNEEKETRWKMSEKYMKGNWKKRLDGNVYEV